MKCSLGNIRPIDAFLCLRGTVNLGMLRYYTNTSWTRGFTRRPHLTSSSSFSVRNNTSDNNKAPPSISTSQIQSHANERFVTSRPKLFRLYLRDFCDCLVCSPVLEYTLFVSDETLRSENFRLFSEATIGRGLSVVLLFDYPPIRIRCVML